MAEQGVTNEQFADAVGIHYTMASRLRSGARSPSARVLSRIQQAYDLPQAEVMDAYAAGPATFSAYLRERVFRDPAPVAASA